jgi:hypothetical protein
MIPRGTFTEKPHRTPVYDAGGVEGRRALHLGTETELGIFVGAGDSGFRLMKTRKDFLGVVTNG